MWYSIVIKEVDKNKIKGAEKECEATTLIKCYHRIDFF